MKFLISIPIVGTFFTCNNRKENSVDKQAGILEKNARAMELSKSMTKQQVFAMLDQRVQISMEKSNNCAQSTFYALSEQFGLGGSDVLKALTPMPGIAERGETCGAITGALMAMGLIYGRDQMDDWKKYRSSLLPANRFCQQFECELGSTLCCKIQERAFGKSFNLMDPNDLKEFQKLGATGKCTIVVQKACRLAAEIILTHES